MTADTRVQLGLTERRPRTRVRRGTDMQPDADDTSLAFCQMMQAKDEQIRRLVLRMERCVSTRSSHPTPPVGQHSLSCSHVLAGTACSCNRPARS